MRVIGDYARDGYAHIQGLLPEEVTRSFLVGLKAAAGDNAIPLSRVTEFPNLLKRPAFEVYGHHYPPMLHLLWGLTPTMCALTGYDLLPSYDYFRIYREGDVCRVHHDRPSCEHSLSLTIDYSDGEPWALEIGKEAGTPSARVTEDFGDEPFAAIEMGVGDAVLYRGVEHRHGRMTPNRNGWSAHLFLHWVDRDGPHRNHAFDGHGLPPAPNFQFA